MKEYQVTLMCNNGKYKPISTIIKVEDTATADDIRTKGIQSICFKKQWGKAELKSYGYTKVKARVYDKEKIARENAERYARLKEEKYASGEWKPSKAELEARKDAVAQIEKEGH